MGYPIGAEVPIFLRIWGKFSNIQSSKAQKIMLFFDGWEPLPKDFSEPYEIDCGTSSQGNSYVRAYYFPGFSSRTNASSTFYSYLTRSRLDIIFSTDIISISSDTGGDVNIACPIKIVSVLTSSPTFTIALATGKPMTGTFSPYTQNLG